MEGAAHNPNSTIDDMTTPEGKLLTAAGASHPQVGQGSRNDRLRYKQGLQTGRAIGYLEHPQPRTALGH